MTGGKMRSILTQQPGVRQVDMPGALFAVIAHRKLTVEIIRLANEDESAFDFMLYMIMTEPAEQIAVMLERMYL